MVRASIATALVALAAPVSAFLPTSLPSNGLNAFMGRSATPYKVSTTPKTCRATPTMALTVTDADLHRIATEARGLAMDSIGAAHSGHLGLPLGCSEIGAVLWGKLLQYYPDDPQWLNRDRFILSGGHGSMFIYSWLHLSGYALPLEEVKKFRQYHSMTPGHPEFPNSEHNTPGIEATTGPLGQGLANAVGMGAAQKSAAAIFNTDKHKIFDQHIFALAGDGCIQEGVTAEAAAFAAHEKLDNVIALYDANDVTLDAMADKTQSEDVAARFRAYGWEVTQVNGHDLHAVEAAITFAKNNDNGQPKLIIFKTIIGKGIDEVAGTNAAHGEAGVKFIDGARAKLGLPAEKWYVSPETRTFFSNKKADLKASYDAWKKTFGEWEKANPDKAKILADAVAKKVPSVAELFAKIPEFDTTKKLATRDAGAAVIQPIAAALPLYVSGSADLHGSTKNYIKGVGDFGATEGKTYAGRNFFYGIREHAMGSIMNGLSYFGLHKPSGATFLVFADYMRATVRVAALAELPVSYIWTHDSVGVGEDGPTHQPVETVSSMRVIPNLDVIRPADPEETAGAYVASVTRKDGPTALILTRQVVPVLPVPVALKREGVLKGGYVIKKETGDLKLILLASGSEVQFCMEAAEKLGAGVRVVSMPCFEIFDRQSAEYKESVLPKACTKRIAMEAGVTPLWYKYVGLDGKVIGTDKFGFSAPGDMVFKEFGITTENLLKVADAYK